MLQILPPVHFANARDAQVFENRPHTPGHKPPGPKSTFQFQHRIGIEMIVMVVGNQHGIDPGQVRDFDRVFDESRNSGQRRRSDPATEHRVRQDNLFADLNQGACVAQPERPVRFRSRAAQNRGIDAFDGRVVETLEGTKGPSQNPAGCLQARRIAIRGRKVLKSAAGFVMPGVETFVVSNVVFRINCKCVHR